MASVFWIQPKFALTIASQLENLPVSAAHVGQLGTFCDKPVIVLSASTAPEERRKEHAAMAGRLPLGDYVLAGNSNHWIMQEEPDLVVHAIEKVVKFSRTEVTGERHSDDDTNAASPKTYSGYSKFKLARFRVCERFAFPADPVSLRWSKASYICSTVTEVDELRD